MSTSLRKAVQYGSVLVAATGLASGVATVVSVANASLTPKSLIFTDSGCNCIASIGRRGSGTVLFVFLLVPATSCKLAVAILGVAGVFTTFEV